MRTDEDDIYRSDAERLEMTADNVEVFIEKRKYVTFVELQRHFRDADGNQQYGDLINNVVYWSGLSVEICEVLVELVNSGRIYGRPAYGLTYLIDGGLLDLPIAKRTVFKYKNRRWMPMVFNPISLLEQESKAAQDTHSEFMAEIAERVNNER